MDRTAKHDQREQAKRDQGQGGRLGYGKSTLDNDLPKRSAIRILEGRHEGKAWRKGIEEASAAEPESRSGRLSEKRLATESNRNGNVCWT